MESISPGGRKISRRRSIGIREATPVISRRTFAFVKNWSVSHLLTETRKAQIGEAFHGFNKIVDPRLSVGFQTKVFPEFMQVEERAGLRVLAIFAFKKIAQDAEIALIARQSFDFKISGGGG